MKYQLLIQSLHDANQCELLGTFIVDLDADRATELDHFRDWHHALQLEHVERVKVPDHQFLTCDENSQYFQHDH